jgi:hypothetical protein
MGVKLVEIGADRRPEQALVLERGRHRERERHMDSRAERNLPDEENGI